MKSLPKIAACLGIKKVPYIPIASFSQDSRLVDRGGLFFALCGARAAGTDHLAEVAKRGGYAAVVPLDYRGPDYGLVLLYVPDPLAAMHHLARSALLERQSRVIGITGSAGKTTTRHFLTQLLEDHFYVAASPKNYNAQATMPLVILNSEGSEDFLVLEMGLDHPGELAKLVAVAPTDYAVLSTITLAHYFSPTSTFQTMDEVAAEKAQILSSKTRFAVIHRDAAAYPAVRERCHCDHTLFPVARDIKTPFRAGPLRECLSGAIEMALHLGVPMESIIAKVPLLHTFERRWEKAVFQGITFINDAYNSNPLACTMALRHLPKPKSGGKSIAVLGVMPDLGEYSLVGHRQVGREALQYVDEVLCFGEECRAIIQLFTREGKYGKLYTSRPELKRAVLQRAKEGDVVLVKGGNCCRLWEIVPRV